MDGRPRCVDVVTLPYPGFPTDLQPMAVALAAVSTGTALITENVFQGRFMFVNELVRLGADVRIDGHHAVVRGREKLSSAPVRSEEHTSELQSRQSLVCRLTLKKTKYSNA